VAWGSKVWFHIDIDPQAPGVIERALDWTARAQRGWFAALWLRDGPKLPEADVRPVLFQHPAKPADRRAPARRGNTGQEPAVEFAELDQDSRDVVQSAALEWILD